MRPSSSLTCDPGTERVLPWGRDLFTFVTSAAGHMMRTLQRPRKNRPSKRQVNHRRFLHNMIHRKFAEIEAANHQLASALFSTDNDVQNLSPCQVVKSSQLDEASKEESTNMTLCLPVFSLDDPDPENIPEEQSCLWAISSQLESPSEQAVHSHKRTFITGNGNSERAANHLTSSKENSGMVEETKDAACGEVISSRQHCDFDSCFDFEVEPIKTDFMKFTETRSVENEASEYENVQGWDNAQIQPLAAGDQPPCVDVPILKSMPAFSLYPHSLAFSDLSIPSVTEYHTEQNNFEKPSQTDILDNFGIMNMTKDEVDYKNLQSPSISFWEAQDEGIENCRLNFGSAFLNCANSSRHDTIKSQQCSNQPITLTSNMIKPHSSMYNRIDSLHRNTKSKSDPNADTVGNTSHINRSGRPYYCSKQDLDLMIPFSEKYNTDSFTSVCPNLVSFDQIRMTKGTETSPTDRCLSMTGSCRYEQARQSNNAVSYDEGGDLTVHKENRWNCISTLECSDATCYNSYTSGHQRKLTHSAHTFSDLLCCQQGASEYVHRDSEQQADLLASCYFKPISEIPANQLCNHSGAPNPASVQNSCSQVHGALSCRKGGLRQKHNLFAGVARSFPPTSTKRHLRYILTPPPEDDWLFEDITKLN